MDYLPIMLRLQDRKVLVVGGGQVATRKVAMLLRAGASVRLVADTVDPALAQTLSEPPHEVLQKRFQPEHVDGVTLVVAATNNNEVNLQVCEQSRERGVPVNVVDNPALCDFIFPSIVDRSPVIVAVSSGGKSPVLARLLRSRLETYIPSGFGNLADLLGNYREKVKKIIPAMSQRMRFWESVMSGPVAEQMMSGKKLDLKMFLMQKQWTFADVVWELS